MLTVIQQDNKYRITGGEITGFKIDKYNNKISLFGSFGRIIVTKGDHTFNSLKITEEKPTRFITKIFEGLNKKDAYDYIIGVVNKRFQIT